MKHKKIMLVSLVLLAVLTIGAVSAEDALSLEEDAGDTLNAPADDVDLSIDDETDDIDDIDDVDDDSGDDIDDEPVKGTEDVTINVEFPSEVVAGERYTVNVTFDRNVTGEVNIGSFWADVYGNYTSVSFYTYEFGGQTYNVEYSGDETYAPKTVSGDFTVSKYIITLENDYEVTYGETHTFEFVVPYSFENPLAVILNGKDRYNATRSEEDNRYFVDVGNFNPGNNTLRAIYHDDDYGDFDGNFTVTAEYNIVCREYVKFGTGDVHLSLPADANGTLCLYEELYDDEENYITNLIANATMKDGFASISLADWGLGEYDVRATYEGDEKYDVNTRIATINVEPQINYPDIIFPGQDSYAEVFAPKDFNGTLIFSEWVEDEDTEEEISVERSAPVINGYGKLSLNGLSQGTHSFYIMLNDKNDKRIYSNEGDSEIEVIEIDLDHLVDGIMDGEEVVLEPGYYIELPYELKGSAKVYVDDKLIGNATGSDTYIEFPQLEDGPHTVKVVYSGPETNFTSTMSFMSLSCKITLPEDDMNVKYDYITVELSPYTNGTINVYIDGKLHSSIRTYHSYNSIYLSDVAKLGTHKVKVTFTDANNKLIASKQATFDLCYSIGFIIGDDGDDENILIYGRENYIGIDVPSDLSGDLIVTVDGKKYKWFSNGGEIFVDVTGLPVGYHEIIAAYAGDEKYYEYENSMEFEVIAKIRIVSYEPISLTLPKDAEGNLVIDIYNNTGFDSYDEEEIYEFLKTVTVPLVKGKAVYDYNELGIGCYRFDASYDGDDYYVSEESESLDVSMSISDVENLRSKEEATVNITIPGANSGTLKINVGYVIGSDEEGDDILETVDSKSIKASTLNSYKFSQKLLGSYKLTAEYIVNGNVVATEYIYIHVVPNKVVLPQRIVYKNPVNVSVELPSDATGVLNLTISATAYYINDEGEEQMYYIFNRTLGAPFENGVATIEVPGDLLIEKYDFTINYTGDYGYFEDAVFVDVVPNITLPKDASTGEKSTIDFEMEGATGEIGVLIDGYEEIKAIIKDGKASVELPKGLRPGSNGVFIRFTDDKGVNQTYYDSITVKKTPDMDVAVSAATVTTNLIIKVSLDDKYADGTVTVKLNGAEKTANIESGYALFNFGKLAYGVYPVEATYNGNDLNNPVSKNATARVTYDPAIKAKNYVAFYNEAIYSAIVYGYNKKAAAKTLVVFKINGKYYGKAYTNNKGVAAIKIKLLPKTYKITTVALGKSVTKALKVKQVLTLKAVAVKKSAKKLVLTAVLKSKKPLKNKKVFFKFNGKTYKAFTNKKGIAKVTVKKSALNKLKVGKKVKYQVTYLKDTVKKTAKVKK